MTTIVVFADIFKGHFSNFDFQITIWLWFTVLFANFAEAVCEGRGRRRQIVYVKAVTDKSPKAGS